MIGTEESRYKFLGINIKLSDKRLKVRLQKYIMAVFDILKIAYGKRIKH